MADGPDIAVRADGPDDPTSSQPDTEPDAEFADVGEFVEVPSVPAPGGDDSGPPPETDEWSAWSNF